MTQHRAEKEDTRQEASGAEKIIPYGAVDHKGEQVERMFDSIAPAYDFMNGAMTFGMHRMWRRSALKRAFATYGVQKGLKEGRALKILDVATGTGDFALHIGEKNPEAEIIGVDLSEGMLKEARRKYEESDRLRRGKVTFEAGDCLKLRFEDNSFDLITVAYGVRNFERLSEGLREMQRVLRPGGTLCILELSCPESTLPRVGYDIYTRYLIPVVGKMISGDSDAYTYLPKSIAAAPQRGALTKKMEEAGFSDTEWHSMTLGVVTVYIATKQ